MNHPRKKNAPHKGWKKSARSRFRTSLTAEDIAVIIHRHHDERNPIAEYLDAADAILVALTKSAPHVPSSLPSGESDPSVMVDSRGADTRSPQEGGGLRHE